MKGEGRSLPPSTFGRKISFDARRLVPLVTLDACIVYDCADIAIPSDRHVNGLMHLQVVIGARSDESEIVDEGEVERVIDEWDRVVPSVHAGGVVNVTSDLSYTYNTLRLSVGLEVRPVAVDGCVVLKVEHALNQHHLTRPVISARDKNRLGKRD